MLRGEPLGLLLPPGLDDVDSELQVVAEALVDLEEGLSKGEADVNEVCLGPALGLLHVELSIHPRDDVGVVDALNDGVDARAGEAGGVRELVAVRGALLDDDGLLAVVGRADIGLSNEHVVLLPAVEGSGDANAVSKGGGGALEVVELDIDSVEGHSGADLGIAGVLGEAEVVPLEGERLSGLCDNLVLGLSDADAPAVVPVVDEHCEGVGRVDVHEGLSCNLGVDAPLVLVAAREPVRAQNPPVLLVGEGVDAAQESSCVELLGAEEVVVANDPLHLDGAGTGEGGTLRHEGQEFHGLLLGVLLPAVVPDGEEDGVFPLVAGIVDADFELVTSEVGLIDRAVL
mmetsp:Transcript_12752/g.25348  ORF Transcript_12752/g.25348 Transcript_12752/m.25348 type:complete len:344 (-) Transcript_12752:1672-2703(-)